MSVNIQGNVPVNIQGFTHRASSVESFDQDLTAFNTLGLQSRAAALWRYESASELPDLSLAAGRHDRAFVLGGGSNVVLAPNLDCVVVTGESNGVRLLQESTTTWTKQSRT